MNLEPQDYPKSISLIKEIKKTTSEVIYQTFIKLIQNEYSDNNQYINVGLIYLGVKILLIDYKELFIKFLIFINCQHYHLLGTVEKLISPWSQQISKLKDPEKTGLVKILCKHFQNQKISDLETIFTGLLLLKNSS